MVQAQMFLSKEAIKDKLNRGNGRLFSPPLNIGPQWLSSVLSAEQWANPYTADHLPIGSDLCSTMCYQQNGRQNNSPKRKQNPEVSQRAWQPLHKTIGLATTPSDPVKMKLNLSSM